MLYTPKAKQKHGNELKLCGCGYGYRHKEKQLRFADEPNTCHISHVNGGWSSMSEDTVSTSLLPALCHSKLMGYVSDKSLFVSFYTDITALGQFQCLLEIINKAFCLCMWLLQYRHIDFKVHLISSGKLSAFCLNNTHRINTLVYFYLY